MNVQPVPLVRGWNLIPFVHFLRGVGAPVERWLAESGIHPGVLARPERPVPLQRGLDFFERAARAEGAETLGIDVGRQTAAECLGAFGARLTRCVTLLDRARTSSQLLSRSTNCQSLWLESDGSIVRVHARINGSSVECRRHADDFTLMLVMEAIGRAGPPGWKPDAIYLPGERPARFARDELFQGVQMIYGAQHVTVVFTADLLGRPVRPVNLPREPEASQAAGSAKDGDVPTDFVNSLEEAVICLLPFGCPSVEDLAEVVSSTPRTLQRRVRACGNSLRQIVERARFRVASEFLGDPSASVTDIALELGYSDSTAFTRAFRRMSGMPPTQYRDRHLSN